MKSITLSRIKQLGAVEADDTTIAGEIERHLRTATHPSRWAPR
jgi:hypothetical protein